ncbi:MAG TPA: hypothetical protein VGB72_06245 [Acidobacteriota bacterium]
MKIDPVPEGLNGGDDAGHKRASGHNLEIASQGPEGRAAEIPQKPTLVLEEDPQHLGHREDDLAVRDIKEKFLERTVRVPARKGESSPENVNRR